jgi:hypothetical protein
MFGAPVGISAAEADIRANQLAELALSEGAVKLEQSKMVLSQQKQMLEMMKGGMGQGGQRKPGDADESSSQLASMMDSLAVMAAKSGLPEQARQYASAGSTIKVQASAIQKNELDAQVKHLNMIGSLMENVHDEVSWRQANKMYEMQTGKPTPYANKPYDPRMVEQLRVGVASAKDRALTAAAKARKDSSESEIEERQVRRELIKAQTKLATERTVALKKAGGKALLPKEAYVRAVTDLVVKDYGAGVLPEDARVLARPIAERMVTMIRDQGLPISEAANRAYQEAKSAGAFGGMRPRPKMSGSFDKPLDIPEDSTKLRTNMYYHGKGQYSGKVFLWNGKAFVPVGSGPGEIPPVKEDEDEVVDSESEEESEDDSLYYDPSKAQAEDSEEAQ